MYLTRIEAESPCQDEIDPVRTCHVSYIYSPLLIRAADALPVNQRCALGKGLRRHAMVHELINGYGLLEHQDCNVVEVTAKATRKQACVYHDREYIDALASNRNSLHELKAYNLVEDCERFKGVYEHSLWVLAATLTACEQLTLQRSRVAINWTGGRHHAQSCSASGFCYINDVVLAILKLQDSFAKVLCVDLGDGQETAFYHSDAVYTLSFHILEKGFFPGVSGQANATGEGRGQGFNRNVPVQRAMKAKDYVQLFKSTISPILEEFKPDAVVVICGADSLKGDPRGGLELSHADMWECVQVLRDSDQPLLVLGGGGYKFTAVSRCWTYLTCKLLGDDIGDREIPEHEYFEFYGPTTSCITCFCGLLAGRTRPPNLGFRNTLVTEGNLQLLTTSKWHGESVSTRWVYADEEDEFRLFFLRDAEGL